MFKISKLNIISLWTWDVQNDTCAICRNMINEDCIECQDNGKDNDQECIVTFGVCNHSFHHHCISRWLKNREVCPLDNQAWAFQ